MHMGMPSSEEEREQVDVALDYLRDMHEGRRPEKPGVDQQYITAAMKEWVEGRKNTLSNIESGFADLARASKAGESVFDIRVSLSFNIENYNGIFFPGLMESYEAATSLTPPEGWLFQQPPRKWRMIRKTHSDMRPMDHESLYFNRKPSSYILAIEGMGKLDPDSAVVGSALHTAFLLLFVAAYQACLLQFQSPAFIVSTIMSAFSLAFVFRHLRIVGKKAQA